MQFHRTIASFTIVITLYPFHVHILGNEVMLAKTEFEGVSKDNNNLNDWLTGDANVLNEIRRGKKLREKKTIPDVTEKELIVPNIKHFESFVKQPRVRYRDSSTYLLIC